jgi:hypothetical protein
MSVGSLAIRFVRALRPFSADLWLCLQSPEVEFASLPRAGTLRAAFPIRRCSWYGYGAEIRLEIWLQTFGPKNTPTQCQQRVDSHRIAFRRKRRDSRSGRRRNEGIPSRALDASILSPTSSRAIPWLG